MNLKANEKSRWSKPTLTITGVVLLLLAVLFRPGWAQAEVIWSGATTIAGDTDVLTNGSAVYAYDWANNVETVNGVNFTGSSSPGGAPHAGIAVSMGSVINNTTEFGSEAAAPFDSLSDAYQGILAGGDYANTGNAAFTVTLGDLSAGKTYAVQLWVNDDRSGGVGAGSENVTGSNAVLLAYNNLQNGGGVGQTVVGVFTATGASQTFTMEGPGATQLNALQVRNVTGTGFTVTPGGGEPAALWVHFGTNGLLQYYSDTLGNRLPDFSFAGYLGGGVSLPVAPVMETISPVAGDNTANIQNALNGVSALTPNAAGIRGAVLLNPGTYPIAGTLSLDAGGVVVRGSGDNTNTGTVLLVTGPSRNVLTVGGTGSWSQTGPTYTISDAYVPLGATNFHVTPPPTFGVGATIIVQRPKTLPWIDAIGMNTLSNPWTAGTGLQFERQVTAISGNQITVDVPLCNPIESVWTTGEVYQVTDAARSQFDGVENLCAVAQFTDYPSNILNGCFLVYQNLKNSWARDLFMAGWGDAIDMNTGAKWCTVQDCQYVQPGTGTASAAPAAYAIDDGVGYCLYQRCASDGGYYHIMVTQSGSAGPDVFLNFTATGTHFNGGPHQRWAAGVLHDNICLGTDTEGDYKPFLAINNRGNDGTGQGWSAGFSVMYNCQAPQFQLEEPATTTNHYNWTIGGIGDVANFSDMGIYDMFGTIVSPHSLYLEQLKERLGPAAVQNIGYPVFILSAMPANGSVLAGGNTAFSVNVAGTNYFSDTVALSVTGLPAGATATFSTNLIAGTGAATLTISAAPSLAASQYPVTLVAVDGNLTNSATVNLTVTAPVPPTLTGPPDYNRDSGTFSFNFGGPGGQSYRVLTSTNLLTPLTNWLVLTSGIFGLDSTNFSDRTTNETGRFYRIASP